MSNTNANAASTASATGSNLPVVAPTASIPFLAQKLRDERLSAAIVSNSASASDGSAVIGIVTERDICKSVIGATEFNLNR